MHLQAEADPVPCVQATDRQWTLQNGRRPSSPPTPPCSKRASDKFWQCNVSVLFLKTKLRPLAPGPEDSDKARKGLASAGKGQLGDVKVDARLLGSTPLPGLPAPLYSRHEELAAPGPAGSAGQGKPGQAVGMQGPWQAAVRGVDQQGGSMHRHQSSGS